jgi:hypothetical protein
MRIVLRLTAGALALAMASPAAAYGDRYGYRDDGDGYRGSERCCQAEPSPYDRYPEEACCERRQPPPRDWREDDCGCYGEIRLNDAFFADSGGVGPAWIGGGGGGGGGFALVGGGASAGAGASASASASARASVNVSIRFRGGFRGGKGGHRGGGGGCGC